MASWFSTLTAITSTPRVIQASTTSFCFAGSGSVGPSQSSSTPSCLRRLLGALAAADEVGVALALGHHRDDRLARRVAGGRGSDRPDRSPGRSRRSPPRVRRSDWTSIQLLAATISAPREDDGAEHGYLEFLTSSCSVAMVWRRGPRLRLPREQVRPVDRGDEQTPVRIPASSAGWSVSRRPFWSSDDREQAQHRAEDVPRPPKIDVAAEHHRGDRQQLVAGARVGLRLAEVRDVDDRREARHEPREHVDRATAAVPPACPAYRAPSGEKPIAYSAAADARAVQPPRQKRSPPRRR